MTMELTLAPDTQRMLEEKLKEGRSADEVVQAGILALNGHFLPELTMKLRLRLTALKMPSSGVKSTDGKMSKKKCWRC